MKSPRKWAVAASLARGALVYTGPARLPGGLIPASAGSTLYDQQIFEPKCHSSLNLYETIPRP